MPKVVITLDCPATVQAALVSQMIETLKCCSKKGCVSIDETDYAVQNVAVKDGDILVVKAEAGYGKMNKAIDDTLKLTVTA